MGDSTITDTLSFIKYVSKMNIAEVIWRGPVLKSF
jgi:hypothetical protein